MALHPLDGCCATARRALSHWTEQPGLTSEDQRARRDVARDLAAHAVVVCPGAAQLPDGAPQEAAARANHTGLVQLVITRCTTIEGQNITSLPSNLFFADSLGLINLRRLQCLPNDLRVVKHLSLTDTVALQGIPAGLQAGSLSIQNTPALACIDPTVKVEARFSICDANKLKTLPDSLGKVVEGFKVNRCRRLETLSAAVDTRCCMLIESCMSLKSVSLEFASLADVTISDCKSLCAVGITAKAGRVSLCSLAQLNSVRVSNSLHLALVSCPAIVHLTRDKSLLLGSLKIEDCPNLTHIAPYVAVKGMLLVKNCTKMRTDSILSLSASSLDICNTPLLSRIPADFAVQNLEITRCESLRTIGSRLSVSCKLQVRQCNWLKWIGNDISASRIVIQGCRRLRVIKDGWSTLFISIENCPALDSIGSGTARDGAQFYHCPALAEPLRISTSNLEIERATAIKTLLAPGNYNFRMLKVSSCFALETLSSNSSTITCTQGLKVNTCPVLRSFAGHMQVASQLTLHYVPSLRSLSLDNVEQIRALEIDGMRALRELPDGLELDMLRLTSCSKLRELPVTLKAINCTISQLPRLERLSGQFRKLTLKDLPRLRGADSAIVASNISVTDCKDLEHLQVISGQLLFGPPQAILQRCGKLLSCKLSTSEDGAEFSKVTLSYCSSLVTLDIAAPVNDLVVRSCSSLKELSTELCIRNSLAVSDCQALVSVPRELDLKGFFHLGLCPSLLALPLSITAPEIKIWHCDAVSALPEQVTVSKLFSVTDCTKIVSAPNWLRVRGSSSAQSLHGEQELEHGAQHDGERELENGTQHDAAGAQHSGSQEGDVDNRPELTLCRTGIPTCELMQVLTARAFQMDFQGILNSLPNRALDRARAWADLGGRPCLGARICSMSKFDQEVMCTFLSLLGAAQEGKQHRTLLAMAARVCDVLELLETESGDVVALILQRMGDSIDRCNDKPMWALNQMEVMVRSARARGDRSELRRLGKSIMRLGVVQEHAFRIGSTMTVDDVSLFLQLEILLREELDLPVSTTTMIHTIHIDEEALANMKADALAITDEAFEGWLLNWDEWQRQLRLEAAARLKWDLLPLAAAGRAVSLALGPVENLYGEQALDPICLPSGLTCSLADFVRHWVATSRDFNNVTVRIPDLEFIRAIPVAKSLPPEANGDQETIRIA